MSRFHLPVIMMLLTLAGCTSGVSHVVTLLNDEAALAGDLPMDPLRWDVITFGANPSESTMSTLFGNDIGVEYARRESAGNYPPGSVLSFVTWQRQEDGRWFGARMPARVKSVEFVEFPGSEEGHSAVRYRLYSGYPLKQESRISARGCDAVAGCGESGAGRVRSRVPHLPDGMLLNRPPQVLCLEGERRRQQSRNIRKQHA
jgi:hypothetical protein